MTEVCTVCHSETSLGSKNLLSHKVDLCLCLSLFHFIRTQDHAFIFSELERKISVRSTRDELIKKGVIKERVDDTIVEANENQNNATTTIQADTVTTSPDTAVVKAEENHAPATVEQGMCLK